MNNTALNVIAIGIFVTTMTSLLTPVLNISPAIPAGFAATVLGLLTIDNFSWQGKGATIFLDWIASFSPTHRQRIIRHEAGHFLTAYFLGIPITGYTLSPWEAWRQGQPGLGGVAFDTESLFDKTPAGGDVRLILDRFCTVWMAGIAAEEMFYPESEGGGDDRQKIREALATFGYPAKTGKQKQRWAQLQANTMLIKYRQAYDALVEAMTNRASVEECTQAIQENCSIN